MRLTKLCDLCDAQDFLISGHAEQPCVQRHGPDNAPILLCLCRNARQGNIHPANIYQRRPASFGRITLHLTGIYQSECYLVKKT